MVVFPVGSMNRRSPATLYLGRERASRPRRSGGRRWTSQGATTWSSASARGSRVERGRTTKGAPMGHMLDRGDVLDLLEEAVTSRRPVTVELRNDKRFVDRV